MSIKRYAQMKLARAKTDKFDAALISGFGDSQEMSLWTLPAARVLEMQQLMTLEEQFLVQRRALLNQQEAFEQSPFASETALKGIRTLVKAMDRELDRIEAELERVSKAHYPRLLEILCSIPRMGRKTAQALIVATRGFREKTNGWALCTYVCIAPRPFQSGTSIRALGRISKMGNRSVRNKVYMCSLIAIRCNPACKPFHERRRRHGKPAKVALIAVAAKLLR